MRARGPIVITAVACAGVIVSHIFGRFSYSLLLPSISDDLVGSFTGAGFLGASYFGGYLAGVTGVTLASTRVEPVAMLRIGLGLSALALATVAVAPTFGVLATGLFFTGLAGAGIWIPAPTIAAARMPEHRRGLVMGALTASMGIGMLVLSQGTNLYRSIIGDDSTWRPVFGVEALLTVAVFVAALALVPTRLSSPETQAGPVELGQGTKPSARLVDFDGLRSIPRWKLLTTSYVVFAVLAGSWTQFLGLAMEQDAGYSDAHISNLYSFYAVAGIAGPLLLGRASDRIGRDQAIMIACVVSAAASVLVTFGSEPHTAIGAALYGFGSFSVPPLTAAAVRDHLEGRRFASAFGAMTIAYAVVSMVASQLSGVLADATGGFDTVYLLLAACSVAAGVVAARRRVTCR